MAANTPTIKPTTINQAEKFDHMMSPLAAYAISVTRAPTKQTMGTGTNIG
jgi:hypothetical protein